MDFKTMNKAVILVVLSAIAVVQAVKKPAYTDRFMDYGVYKIENRAIVGVLTFNKTDIRVPPLTAEFDDANPGQRWRLDESALYTAFEIRPTLDENYVLEYWNSRGFLRWVGSWGFGNNKLWYLKDAGDGFTLIKNKHNDICLQSTGINRPVTGSICDSTHEQQWKFVFTS